MRQKIKNSLKVKISTMNLIFAAQKRSFTQLFSLKKL